VAKKKQEELNFPEDENIIEVPSMTDPDVSYKINKAEKTCSCPAFRKSKGKKKQCKHLIAAGVIKLPKPPKYPSQSMAMSALIKATRLRFKDEAIYWLYYLWTQFPDQQSRFRLNRRILIMCAEDNISIPTMNRVGGWFTQSYKVGSTILSAAVETMRIMSSPNWYEQEDGRDFIRAWKGEYKNSTHHKTLEFPAMLKELREAVEEMDIVRCLGLISHTHKTRGFDARGLAREIHSMAIQTANLEARLTVGVFADHANALYYDTNYTGQALYRLCRGQLGLQVSPKVDRAAVANYLKLAKEDWKDPKPIPSYYLDGIHTSGSDRRFAGSSRSMGAACNAFEHFGRLHPDDDWKADFWK